MLRQHFTVNLEPDFILFGCGGQPRLGGRTVADQPAEPFGWVRRNVRAAESVGFFPSGHKILRRFELGKRIVEIVFRFPGAEPDRSDLGLGR